MFYNGKSIHYRKEVIYLWKNMKLLLVEMW